MATLTEDQFNSLNSIVNDPEQAESDEAKVFASDPALREEADRLLTEFRQEALVTKFDQNVRMLSAPGAAFTNIVHGAQDTAYGGLVMSMDVIRAITPEDSAVNKTMTDQREQVQTMRAGAEAAQRSRIDELLGDQPGGRNFFINTGPRFAGEVLPFMYAPSGLSTYWRTVGFNGVVGGLAGGVLDKDAENFRDRFGEITIGGLAGTVISGALHAPQGFRALAARRLQSELQTDLAAANIALEKEVQRATGDLDFTFSLGELTANPFLVGLEIGAAKQATRASQNTRISTLIDAMKLRANKLSSSGNADQIAVDLNRTIVDVNSKLQARASSNYATALDNVIVKHGEEAVIDGRHYLSEAQRLIAEYTDPTLGGSRAPPFLVQQVKELDDLIYPATTVKEVTRGANGEEVIKFAVRRKDDGLLIGRFDKAPQAAELRTTYNLDNGGLDAETTGKLLQQFGRIARGEVPIFENAAPGSNQNLSLALKKAMMESLDDGVVSKDAVAAIQSLRKVYQMDQAQIRGINNSLLAGIFGVDDVSAVNAQTAWKTLVGRSQEAQRGTAKILEDLNPGLLDDIRAEQIKQWVNKSFVPAAPQSITPYSPVRLASQLAGDTGATGGAARGIFAAEDILHLRKTGEALRTINETYLSVFPEASGAMMRDASINIISRSPEFFARWMTGLFAQGKTIERMLQDPAFRESIIQVANTGLGGPKSQAAMIYMATTVAAWGAEDEAEARRQKNVEESAPLVQRHLADPQRQ